MGGWGALIKLHAAGASRSFAFWLSASGARWCWHVSNARASGESGVRFYSDRKKTKKENVVKVQSGGENHFLLLSAKFLV